MIRFEDIAIDIQSVLYTVYFNFNLLGEGLNL